MLDLEQSFISAPPRENMSKGVNPAGFRAFDPFSQDSRCSKMQSVADGKRQYNVPIKFSISGHFVPTAWRYAPYERGVRRTFAPVLNFAKFKL